MNAETAPKKVRRAELISPPNILKQKVGSGGLDESVLVKAQDMIEENTVDFVPIATMLMNTLRVVLKKIRKGEVEGEEAIEALIYPSMQIKSQGGMFHFKLVTEMSDILVNFLETVHAPDEDVLEIVNAHLLAISAALMGRVDSDGGASGAALREELNAACQRYYKTHAS